MRKLIWRLRQNRNPGSWSSPGRGHTAFRFLWAIVLEILAIVVALGLAPLFYWRLLTTNPNDAATLPSGDFTDLNYPYLRWLSQQIARGVPPYWNQFVSAGHSAVGDIQYRVFYPPDLWFARLSGGNFTVRLLEMDVVAHVALATVGTYLLARRLTQSRIGGLVSATVFGFGGYLSGFPLQQTLVLEASVWLPLALLCIDLGADYGSLIGFVGAAAALGMSALVGHPQTLLYCMVTCIGYALFKSKRTDRIHIRPLVGAIVVGLGSVALGAITLLPGFAHLMLTDRATSTYDFTKGGFALHEFVGFLFPSSIGGAPLYNGIFTWLLVAIALASPFRRSNKAFWCALGIAALLLSFGANTFLQPIFYLLTDGFKLRDHERVVFLVDFSVSILAGFGAARLASSADLSLSWLRRGLRWPIAAIIGYFVLIVVDFAGASGAQGTLLAFTDPMAFVTLVFGLGATLIWLRERGLISHGMTGLLVVSLVALDLFTVDWQANLRSGPPDHLLSASPVVKYLEQYPTGLFRISSEGLLPGDGNEGAIWRLEDVVGNSPLETKSYSDFTKSVPEWTRWQVLNVRFVITKRKLSDPRLMPILSDGPVNLFEIAPKDRLPRAYFVERVVVAPDHQIALQSVAKVDLKTTAVVEGAVPDWLLATSPVTATMTLTPTQNVDISSYDANDVTVQTTAPRPGLLVVSNVDYPGWHVTVDGSPAPLLEADGIVQAVAITAGDHTIRFRFEPPGLVVGQSISSRARTALLTIVGLEILLRLLFLIGRISGVHRRGRRRPAASRRVSLTDTLAPDEALVPESDQTLG
ncbi:MAG TPA: YfhO family protein [Chloroflexota bacterium]|nr:YfhO family protein [Chloroflexota bacterium]